MLVNGRMEARIGEDAINEVIRILGISCCFRPISADWQRWARAAGIPVALQRHSNPVCMNVKRGRMSLCMRDCVHDLAAQCRRHDGEFTHRCHAGVTEWRFPLYDGGRLGAVLHVGPVSVDDSSSGLVAGSHDPVRLRCLANMLLDHLTMRKRRWEEQGAATDPTPGDRIEGYLTRNIAADPGLREVAAAMNVSIHWASHFVKRATGCNFRQIKDRIRLEEACHLLGETGLKVESVAQASGFGNVGHFYRFFRERMGVTPGEYRRRRDGTGPSPDRV